MNHETPEQMIFNIKFKKMMNVLNFLQVMKTQYDWGENPFQYKNDLVFKAFDLGIQELKKVLNEKD